MNAGWIILIILASILVLFIILIFLKIQIRIIYNDNLAVQLRILFFKIRLLPQKNNKKSKNSESKKESDNTEKKRESGLAARFKSTDINGYINIVKVILNKFIKKLFFDKLDFNATISCENAAETAITYGKLCGVVLPIVASLQRNGKIKNPQIRINTDFTKEKSIYRIDTIISTRVIYMINAFLTILKII